MRWTILGAFCALGAGGAEIPLDLLMTKEDDGCGIESRRLKAAGSMSGIVGGVVGVPAGCASSCYDRRRRIEVRSW